jgi:lysophospholipase L1-like esterase
MASRLTATLHRISWASVLVVAASFAVTLIAAEIGFRLVFPQVFDVHPRGMYSADEAVGYALTPGFNGILERAEFSHEVDTNALGLRGAEPRPRRANTFRIVCLGDSFTWGFGVQTSDTFAARLEQALADKYPALDIQVLNAGVPGYGTADQLRFLESRSAMLDPDLVVLQFLPGNDFMENRRPAKGVYEPQDGWLVVKADALDPAEAEPAWFRALGWVKRNSHLASFVSERVGYLAMRSGLLPQRALSRGYDFDEDDARLAIELLTNVALTADALGAATIFVFSPGQAPVLSDDTSNLPSASAVVADAAREAGAGFIDLTGPLRDRPDRLSLYYPVDGHWSAPGHAAVADILGAYISEHVLDASSR